MALNISGLKRIEQFPLASNANSNFFGYATADAVATVQAAGYFNSARHKLLVGDVIMVKAGLGGTPKLLFLHVATVPAAPTNITVTTETFA